MTTRTAGPAETRPGPGGGRPPGRASWQSWTAGGRPRSSDGALRSVGLALTLLAVVILGFVGYLYFLSGVQEARAQTTLYARLQGELANAVAPTGPVIPGHPVSPASLAAVPGDPVAVLAIPAVGISNLVIVEGTAPENLTLGPGHLPDTPLPGQAGVSVVFGRRATFGGPFGNLPELRTGALITVTTSQGRARYQVIAVSDSSKPVPFSQLPNQLLLVTADSAIAPAHYVEVEAKFLDAVVADTTQSTPFPESGYYPQVSAAEAALGRDSYALIPAMAWAIALAAAALAGSYLAARWARWPAWIVTIPVLAAIVWNLYQALSALLPNLY
ncbi:MAG TPA: sortase [Trebonia sp.]|nr:sortase [Trebonia sp.]